MQNKISEQLPESENTLRNGLAHQKLKIHAVSLTSQAKCDTEFTMDERFVRP
jgi:hypothetical protein